MKNYFFRVILLSIPFTIVACKNGVITEDVIMVYALGETTPVASNDDAADDPAIWVHQQDATKSLILGTDKKRGLMVYNLKGELVQELERGRLNNVDLRQGVLLGGQLQTLAVATNRTNSSLDIFNVSNSGVVSFIQQQKVSLSDPYGLCMYLTEGLAYVFANSKDGEYQQWVLNPHGTLEPQLLGSYHLDSQPEGCVADDVANTLYVGEENFGIWLMPADISRFDEMMVLDVVGEGQLSADVEGLGIYRNTDDVYLIASSQGDYSYAIYDLNNDNRYVGSFSVADNLEAGVDGAEETDGLAVTSIAVTKDFPEGLLVVQDGYNLMPKANQNFKLVSWGDVIGSFILNDNN